MFSKDIGPVELTFGGTVLGNTRGGATLSYNEETTKTTIDKFGTTARAKMIIGQAVTISAAIGEATLAQLAKILGTTVTAGSTTDEVVLQNRVGENLLDSADTLIIKPIIEGTVSATEADWIYVPLATLTANFETPFELENQRAWAFTAEGHPVQAEHIASGGALNGEGWSVNDLLRFGKAD